MNFLQAKQVVEEGDLVILYLSFTAQYPLEVRKRIQNRNGQFVENKFQSIYGMLDVFSLVGKRYGEKIHLPKGWGYILRPTCELWTRNLPHRTQIIYTPDISIIITGLGLHPGMTVVEAGTGSGSLAHSLVRTIHPTGHLYTFDFHEKRAQLVREEFQRHGLAQWVTVGHRDVVTEGFADVIPCKVDAVFLDLPVPWDVVPHVQQILKRGGKLCTFSPCIEQVQKTVGALKSSGDFILIRTMEILQRPMSIQTKTFNSLDFEGESESGGKGTGKMGPLKKEPQRFRTLVPPPQIPGHTGYLTFSTFVPVPNNPDSVVVTTTKDE